MTSGRLAGLLTDGAAQRLIATTQDRTIDLGQFRIDVASTIAQIQAASVGRGLIVCDDAYWAIVALFALAHGGAEAVFPPNNLPSTLSGLSGAFDTLLTDGTLQGDGISLGQGSGSSPLQPMNGEAALVTLFTSGSSGTPKRIAKTILQLELEAEVLDRVMGPTVPQSARVHATVVHQHLYGLTFRICWPLATGRSFFGRPHQFWEPLFAGLRQDDVIVTTPSHLSRLGGLVALPEDRRPSLVVSGGAPLPNDAAEAARTIFRLPVREMIGSTEAGVIASRLRIGVEPPAWQPLPGVTVTRLDDGRMHIISPYLFDENDAVSGDLIDIDSEGGGFRLLGRADRIAKIEGIRVSLTEFDAQIADLAGVTQAAVVVLQGNAPHLGGVVVLNANGAKELAEHGAFRLSRRLRRDLARSLPDAALPRRWRFVKQLPVGPVGKISATDLAALFSSADSLDARKP